MEKEGHFGLTNSLFLTFSAFFRELKSICIERKALSFQGAANGGGANGICIAKARMGNYSTCVCGRMRGNGKEGRVGSGEHKTTHI